MTSILYVLVRMYELRVENVTIATIQMQLANKQEVFSQFFATFR